mmetsp:Transcript_2775/g.5917  ORF Transcript_2775/g.5917 Transcript_2775/m.5917 type:complete len:84 (-) Transcript_2775:2131-2382(-)
MRCINASSCMMESEPTIFICFVSKIWTCLENMADMQGRRDDDAAIRIGGDSVIFPAAIWNRVLHKTFVQDVTKKSPRVDAVNR